MPKSEAMYYQKKRNQKIRKKKATREATVSAIVSGFLMVAIPFMMIASWIVFGY